MTLSKSLEKNIEILKRALPIDTSFDIITRNLYLGETKAFLLSINGLCRTEILQQIVSDLQNPLFTRDGRIDDMIHFVNAKIGYAQVSFCDCLEEILPNVLSGPTLLLIDGFSKAVLIDVRSYPTRGIVEPDVERITRGARDGFVETLLFNTNLIRRRIRSPRLTFSMHRAGTESKTDIALAYLDDCVNKGLLNRLIAAIEGLNITSLTMGSKSLEELLVKKHWWNPLPSMQMTERPDVACSYLLEGHIAIIVDNSPMVLLLPCTVFQFTQSPEDYFKSPLVGTYFRLVRFLCIPVTLFLLPVFLLLTAYFPALSQSAQLLSTGQLTPVRLTFYVLTVEFVLDLFRYSTSLSSSRFSGSLSIVGGILIGDMAIRLNWASAEVLFYAAITLLASLSLSSIEFSEALRVYRLFLLVATGFFGIWGFVVSSLLVLISMITTPTFGGMSYFWPLFPFNARALQRLLFRSPTAKAQPSQVWDRGDVR